MKSKYKPHGESQIMRTFSRLYAEKERCVFYVYRGCFFVERSVIYRSSICSEVDYFNQSQTKMLFTFFKVKKSKDLFEAIRENCYMLLSSKRYMQGLDNIWNYCKIKPKHIELLYESEKKHICFRRFLLRNLRHLTDKV